MADITLRHNTPSPTLRDKIRLFEGKGGSLPHYVSSSALINRSTPLESSNNSYRGTRLSPARATPIERGDSSRRRISELPTHEITSAPVLPITTTTTSTYGFSIPPLHGISSTPELPPPAISPRKWNVITLDPENQIAASSTSSSSSPSSSAPSTPHNTSASSSSLCTSQSSSLASSASSSSYISSSLSSSSNSAVAPSTRTKGKEKVTVLSLDDRDLAFSDEDGGSPKAEMLPILAKSPRRPSTERKYEEEVITLKRMTAEEKQMVKALIKITTRKNKMMDALETNIQQERDALGECVEAEKAALANKLQSLDLELSMKSRELSAEIQRNSDLTEKIQKLERERQDMRMALAASKREARQCKINCDAELNKKTQSLMDMAMQLTALTCLRQSMNCIICEEKAATAVLQPCRHMVMCGSCSLKVTKCPMCRVDIRSKFEIYNNWVI